MNLCQWKQELKAVAGIAIVTLILFTIRWLAWMPELF